MDEIIELIDNNRRKLLIIGLMLEIGVFGLAFFTSEGQLALLLRQAARISPRISLLFFAFFVFIYTSKAHGDNEAKYIYSRNFAIIHFIHWLLLMGAMLINNFPFDWLRIIPGILAYISVMVAPFIYKKELFTRTQLVIWEKWYLFIVWIMFFLTYVVRLTNQSPNATGGKGSYIMGMFFVTLLLIYYMANVRKIVK
jgi:hypothetical protein